MTSERSVPRAASGTTVSLIDRSTDQVVELRPHRLVIAGYTGRDEAKVREHIDELAAIGIAPPPTVPTFYELDPGLLTVEGPVTVHSAATSGEVEPVLIRIANQLYLGVGSDHTDRDMERESVAASKGSCPKPVGREVIPLPTDFTDEAWDAVRIRSTVDGRPYQDGSLAELRTPSDLLGRLREVTGDDGADLVVFAGTLPVIGGTFRYGNEWSVELELPDGPTLRHDYTVEQRSGQ